MSTNSDSVISGILKLYDTVEEHKILNNEQLTNALAQSNVFVSDDANMESSCSNSQENGLLQSRELLDNAKDCCIEYF